MTRRDTISRGRAYSVKPLFTFVSPWIHLFSMEKWKSSFSVARISLITTKIFKIIFKVLKRVSHVPRFNSSDIWKILFSRSTTDLIFWNEVLKKDFRSTFLNDYCCSKKHFVTLDFQRAKIFAIARRSPSSQIYFLFFMRN